MRAPNISLFPRVIGPEGSKPLFSRVIEELQTFHCFQGL